MGHTQLQAVSADTLRVEIDGEWLEFSRYETLVINDSTSGATAIPQNLDDTWTAGIGAEWEFKPQWTLRGGFMYLENPTDFLTIYVF